MVATAKKSREGKIAYIDLFAGPGRYGDDTKSTPLLVLERAVQNPDLCRMLVAFFNDRNPDYVRSLREAIDSPPEFKQFRYPPQVANNQIGDEIVAEFEKRRMIPTLFFVDPWGYKGLSLRLINSVLRNWGSDCIVFFNYNRINMGLNNEFVKEHMDALFGVERAAMLRIRMQKMAPDERGVLV